MRQDFEQTMHKTLTGMGIRSDNVHMLVEWISDYDDEQRSIWMLRAGGMFGIGMILGMVLGYILH